MTSEPTATFDAEKDVVLAFTTPIVYLKAENTEPLNEKLRALIVEKEKSGAGVHKSNAGGWHSETDLAQWDDPSIAALFKLIDPVVRNVFGLVTSQPPWSAGVTYVAWANVNRTHQYNRMHNHPGFHWSGVYYVRCEEDGSNDENSGKIEFQDPRGFASMVPMPGKPFGQTLSIKPRTGSLLVFPSFLFHAVTAYTGNAERISIAFNAQLTEQKPGSA